MLRRRLSWRLAAVPALLFAVSACEDSSTDPPAPVGVGATVEGDANLSTLSDLLSDAGLLSVLNSGGPFTLFAPTNAAFSALPAATLEAVLADDDLLEAVLLNHVVQGEFPASGLTNGQTLQTLGGGSLTVSIQGGTVRIGDAVVSEADREASNGVIHVINAVLVPEPDAELPDLVDTAVDAGFSTLVTAVQAAGLEETLRGDGPFTVFAPTNAAFDALPEGALDDLLADPDALTEILTYHVVPGRLTAEQLSEGLEVETVEGRTLRFTLAGGARVNGVDITSTDIETSNGIIHVIDAVLMPPVDIVETAIRAGFGTLVAAVQAAGLEETLWGEGPFTVFAPTNEAFDTLPEGALDDLLADPDALAEVLTYHVVPGQLFAADLTEGQELTTVQGQTLVITLEGGAQVNGVDISATDVRATNGIIHVIDAVLMP